MRYDIVGCVLLGISAFLYAARYFVAAMFMGPGLKSWSAKLFETSYGYVGDGLTTWSMLALITGLGVIVIGCVVDLKKKDSRVRL